MSQNKNKICYNKKIILLNLCNNPEKRKEKYIQRTTYILYTFEIFKYNVLFLFPEDLNAIFLNFISMYKNLLYFFSVQFPPFSKYSSKPISLANKHCHQKSYCYNTSFYNGVFEMWRRVILGLSFFLHLH